MPTYDYSCPHCNHAFSAFHKMSEAAPPCSECGGEVRKIPVAPAFVGAATAKSAASAPAHGCAAGACGCKHQVS
ncbi:MAG: FmdB family zinc ribbon protein [Methylococcaceae bacterium]